MAKNLMRRYNTQEEYNNDSCDLYEDTLSAIIENGNVNYGVNNTEVIINGVEVVDFPIWYYY